ncbi:MAG: NUDIX hydrolase [Desulfuromonadales bacterium]|nr:NUDIX hydrolase [Desulfuromonadales bacterium]
MTEQPKHVLVTSGLVRNDEGQLLLVKHRLRGWELPQGRVEEGEGLVFALSREILEETGVTVSHARLAVIWSKVSHPAAVIFCFVARYASGSLQPSDETPEVIWCSDADAKRLVSHPVNRDRMASVFTYAGTLRLHSYATGPYRVLS